MIERLKQRFRSQMTVRPTYPSVNRQLLGVLSILFATALFTFLAIRGISGNNGGLILLVLIMFIAYWSGLRAAMIGCAILVAYVWLIYTIPVRALVKDPTHETQSIITTAIFYPLFALMVGVASNLIRGARTREFDAQVAAEDEASHRRRAEADLWTSEEMRRMVVDSSMDAVIAMADDGSITTWNPNAEKLFGWSSAEVVGKQLYEVIVPTRHRQSHLAGLQAFLQTGEGPILSRRVESEGLTKSGKELPVEFTIVPHKVGEGTIFVGFIRDITDRKMAEQVILDLNATLEDRVAERTAQLEAANAELMGFTYSVSHDLRTPLRGIVANSRMLLEESGTELDAKSKDRLQRLETAALKMAQLIENLLQFARIGQTPLRPSEVDISAIANSIAKDLRSHTQGEVAIEENLTTHGDPEMIQLVITNLMENAWKYVPPGEAPRVSVGKTIDGAFFVRDQGIGFDMRYLSKIWEPFERLHHDDEYPGTGIGLANTKRIVQRHGGKIWADSTPGEGSTFFFELR